MPYTGAEYSTEQLFQELKDLAKRENIESYDAYKELIDVMIEEKKSYGFISDEEDLEQIRRSLEARWPQMERSLRSNMMAKVLK